VSISNFGASSEMGECGWRFGERFHLTDKDRPFMFTIRRPRKAR
jgi:hypothetical protein